MSLARVAGLFVLTGMIATTLGAASPGIDSLQLLEHLAEPGPHGITVHFSTAAGLVEKELTNPALWQLVVYYPSGFSTPLAHLTISETQPPRIIGSVSTGFVRLTAEGEVDAAWERVVVSYLGSVGASLASARHADVTKASPQHKPLVAAASGKSDADIYLSGLWVPVVSGTTKYTIDSSIAFRLGPRISPDQWFYFTGAVLTDNSKKVDPNSFRWRMAWRNVPAANAAPILDLGAGMELDRTGNVMNALASSKATWTPVAICSQVYVPLLAPCRDKPGSEVKPAVAYELDFTLGLEWGYEIKDTLRFNNVNFRGAGMLLRGAPQTKLFLNFMKVAPFKQITFETDYDARILARREIFLETRLGTANPVPLLSQRPRQHVVNSINFKVTDYICGTFKHEFGSLPPAFTFVDHKFTVGLTLQLKQNRVLRY